MKLYTHATPSHQVLLHEWLLPGAQKEFDVVVGTSPQYGRGHFDDKEWGRNTHHKAQTMYRAIAENINSDVPIIVWSDCDVQIIQPVKERLLELLDSNDIAIAKNDAEGKLCSGFFIARCNEKTLWLFNKIRDSKIFKIRIGRSVTDQAVLNQLIHNLKYVALPEDEFWSKKFGPPSPRIRVHHANWIVGIQEKICELQCIRDYVDGLY